MNRLAGAVIAAATVLVAAGGASAAAWQGQVEGVNVSGLEFVAAEGVGLRGLQPGYEARVTYEVRDGRRVATAVWCRQ